jgi:type II secretory pathway component GspD/PulD (secretin)
MDRIPSFNIRHSKAMKRRLLPVCILSLLVFPGIAIAGQVDPSSQRTILCLLPLEHADAVELVDVLTPFLSPLGKIAAYSPTNTLLIRDQPSVVKMLIKAIKGKAELSECQNF